VVKGVLSSGLLSNPLKLLSVVTDAAASMTTDSGMTVSDLVGVAESLHSVSSSNVQFVTAPTEAYPADPTARVQFTQPQADAVFKAIAHDVTLPKATPSPSASSAAPQVLTTNPSNVKVTILNGSGASGAATQAAAGLTSRGFDVAGTGDAASFGYTSSVIQYSGAADLAAVNTLKEQLTDVTTKQDSSQAPGTVELILGSDFTGLASVSGASASSGALASSSASASSGALASSSASASSGALASSSASASSSPSDSALNGLAQSNGGITAAASCTSDGSAFTGPLSP
jgi:hypothetical protein